MCLRQALLKVADLSAVTLGRRAGDRGLGFLGLRGLWTPAHEPPFACYESAGDRLGERAQLGKRTPPGRRLQHLAADSGRTSSCAETVDASASQNSARASRP